jgi:hypothetical protein
MRRLVPILAIALLAAVRFCHLDVLWVEEAYPLAAARAMLAGKALYRDIWFDKPPLSALFYVLMDARTGFVLRLAGALFVAFAAWAAWRAASQLWRHIFSPDRGRPVPEYEERGLDVRAWAALLTAFFVTFDFPAAAIALTPDLLTLPFHLLAVGAAAAGQPFLAGLFCGVALGFNGKALFILAVCLLWRWRDAPRLLAGFCLPVALIAAWLASQSALAACWREVWVWGAAYSRDTPLAQPLLEGLRRTLGWAGFHIALVAAAGWVLVRERGQRWRLAAWILISLGAAWMGWRFFPRYFFQLLPAVVLPAARGFALAPPRWRAGLVALLALPFIRFMPASAQLAAETLQDRPHASRDLALFEDARRAALLAQPFIRPSDTALVWGYRPELYTLTGLTAGTPYLDSQPLDGVLADRHLTGSRPTFPALARTNREALLRQPPPTWILDGLGSLNPRLAVFNPSPGPAALDPTAGLAPSDPTAGLAPWRSRYRELGRTRTVILYRLIEPAGSGVRKEAASDWGPGRTGHGVLQYHQVTPGSTRDGATFYDQPETR